MSWFELWLLTRLDAINTVAAMGSVIGLAVGAFVWIMGNVEAQSHGGKEFGSKLQKYGVRAFIVACIATVTAVLVPSEKDMALILAGHWATNNEEMAKLPDNVLRVINGYLEQAVPAETTDE